MSEKSTTEFTAKCIWARNPRGFTHVISPPLPQIAPLFVEAIAGTDGSDEGLGDYPVFVEHVGTTHDGTYISTIVRPEIPENTIKQIAGLIGHRAVFVANNMGSALDMRVDGCFEVFRVQPPASS